MDTADSTQWGRTTATISVSILNSTEFNFSPHQPTIQKPIPFPNDEEVFWTPWHIVYYNRPIFLTSCGQKELPIQHVSNQVPTSIHRAMSPEEKLTGATPMINNLCIFGCHAYAWVARHHRRKLESTSTPCIYLGPERGGPFVESIHTTNLHQQRRHIWWVKGWATWLNSHHHHGLQGNSIQTPNNNK